jgi:hypothetical protein
LSATCFHWQVDLCSHLFCSSLVQRLSKSFYCSSILSINDGNWLDKPFEKRIENASTKNCKSKCTYYCQWSRKVVCHSLNVIVASNLLICSSSAHLIDLLVDAEQLTVFSESADVCKQIGDELKNSANKPILNYAKYTNAELQSDLCVWLTRHAYSTMCRRVCFVFRFDVCLLIKSFNRSSSEEKEKTLKNILTNLKVNGQLFIYESEWTKANGRNK